VRPNGDRVRVLPTRLGYLPIFAEPCNPHRDRASQIGRYYLGDVFDVREVRGDWVRHDMGWSVSKCQGMHFISPLCANMQYISETAEVMLRPVIGRTENDHIVCRGKPANLCQAIPLMDALLPNMSQDVLFEPIPSHSLVNLYHFVSALLTCIQQDSPLPSSPSDTHSLISNILSHTPVLRLYGMVADPTSQISSCSLLDPTHFSHLSAALSQNLPENLLPLPSAVEDMCLVEVTCECSSMVTFSQYVHVAHGDAVTCLRQLKMALNKQRIRLMLVGRCDRESVLCELPPDVLGLIKDHLVAACLPLQLE